MTSFKEKSNLSWKIKKKKKKKKKGILFVKKSDLFL